MLVRFYPKWEVKGLPHPLNTFVIFKQIRQLFISFLSQLNKRCRCFLQSYTMKVVKARFSPPWHELSWKLSKGETWVNWIEDSSQVWCLECWSYCLVVSLNLPISQCTGTHHLPVPDKHVRSEPGNVDSEHGQRWQRDSDSSGHTDTGYGFSQPEHTGKCTRVIKAFNRLSRALAMLLFSIGELTQTHIFGIPAQLRWIVNIFPHSQWVISCTRKLDSSLFTTWFFFYFLSVITI